MAKNGGVAIDADYALNSAYMYQIQNGDTGGNNPYILFYANLKAHHVYWIGIDSGQPLLVSFDGNINDAWTASNKATFVNNGPACYAVIGLGNNGNTQINNFRIYDITELQQKKQNQGDLNFF